MDDNVYKQLEEQADKSSSDGEQEMVVENTDHIEIDKMAIFGPPVDEEASVSESDDDDSESESSSSSDDDEEAEERKDYAAAYGGMNTNRDVFKAQNLPATSAFHLVKPSDEAPKSRKSAWVCEIQ